MPLCTTYNPRNAHASPVQTKTKGKGRGATRGLTTDDADAVVSKTVVGKTVGEKTTTEKTKTGAVLDAINAIREIGAITNASAPSSASAEGTTTRASGEENQNGAVKRRGSVLSNGGNVLVPVTNTSSVGEEKAKEKVDELLEQKNSKNQDEGINEGEGGEGQWRDKEGLAFEHARQRAKKASERAKRRARKAEMQAVAMAFVAPVVEERKEVREKQGMEGVKDVKSGEGGNGLHKGSRVGRVGMRKADGGNFKADVKGMVDLDMSGVDSYFKNAHERVRSMSGELKGVDFGLEGIGREDEEGRREVSLSELVYFAAQKKPRKNKGHDFEMIPALKTVIVLDDVESSADMEMDEAWDHIDDLSMDGEVELSYAKVVAGGGH